MALTGSKKPEHPGKTDEKPGNKPSLPPIQEDEIEDGDFATPKRDRNGDDDRPL